ncbi:CPBP family intramembrane glutamic endopeptidase [Corynebacterium sanguinis]|uniref:CPBP family intramembrane glutamic endopeptidase n=1 Tax=Corynebacterium sanguinis TaxID=2594913 RepID=UPI00223BED42|nr:type II CAAX endopeptidase family protein [Corynebacterium sanguinis]MCT1804795.1 CPBP family intramembrane metalloprotease [Corynebacterium sanguinis]MCT2157823.1 CPBP family intramembrane metalloprotease [Corynebacterium sanguinis]
MTTQQARTTLAYHRVSLEPALRRRPYRRWKPALEFVISLVLFFLIQALFTAVFLLTSWGSGADMDWLYSHIIETELGANPVNIAFFYGAIGISGVGALFAAWLAGRRPRALLSVTGRIRWPIVRLSLLLIAVPPAITFAIDAIVHRGIPAPLDGAFWASIALCLLLVPLQSTAEELVFRGSLPQALGAWIRSPWVVYALSLPPFVFGHTYGASGLISVAVFAAFASLLVHRTGGLEAAIVLHTVNNMSLAYADVAGITELIDTNNRPLVSGAAYLLQYAGALVVLAMLTRYAPRTSEPPPGWFPGSGWYAGWPAVVASQAPSRPRPLASLSTARRNSTAG